MEKLFYRKGKLFFVFFVFLLTAAAVGLRMSSAIKSAYAYSADMTKITSVNVDYSNKTVDIYSIGRPAYNGYSFKSGYKKFFILAFGHSILYGQGKKVALPFKNVVSVSYSQFSTAPKYAVHIVIRQNIMKRPDIKTVNLGNGRYKVIIYASSAVIHRIKEIHGAVAVKSRPFTPVKNVNFNVFIDAGHGGGDPGGIGPMGLPESFVNLSIALKLRKLLAAKGIKTEIDRTSNVNVGLQQRAAEANRSGADLFIGLYCNSVVVPYLYGTTVYYFHNDSYKFGYNLEHYISSHLNLKNDGVVRDDLYVLRFTMMPAVIIEYAYISNPYEEHLLGSSTFRQLIANGIANEIYKYFIAEKR